MTTQDQLNKMKKNTRNTELEKEIADYIRGKLDDEAVNKLWIQLLQNPQYIKLLATEVDLVRVYDKDKKSEASFVDHDAIFI
jgi:hypothetical protein